MLKLKKKKLIKKKKMKLKDIIKDKKKLFLLKI